MAKTPNIPEEMAKKVPDIETYKKGPRDVITYVFMLLFIAYLSWKELISRDDCSDRIATIEQTLKTERSMHERTYTQAMSRIESLEKALDVKNGVIREIGTKVGVEVPAESGGSK